MKDEFAKFLKIAPEIENQSNQNQTGKLKLPKNSYVIDPFSKKSILVDNPDSSHIQMEIKKMINGISTAEGGRPVFKM